MGKEPPAVCLTHIPFRFSPDFVMPDVRVNSVTRYYKGLGFSIF